jgi:hypothetical protein
VWRVGGPWGGPFIGGWGGGGEVASTSDACRGGDDGTQWRRDGSGRRWRRDDSGTVCGDARHQTELASVLMVRRRGG